MQTFNTIRNLTISGKYPLTLTTAELKNIRMLLLDVSVARPPASPYFSDKTNPPNGYLGSFMQRWQDFNIRRYDVEYAKQRFVFADKSDRQIIAAMKCIHELDVINLSSLATQLGQPNLIFLAQYVKDLVVLPFQLNEFFFKCYADTALNIQVRSLKYELCNLPNGQEPDPPLPPPPSPFNVFPPGVPIPPPDFAPPPPGSGDDYAPFPGDLSEPPDPTPLCGNYAVTYTIFNPSSPAPDTFTQTITLPGNAYGTYSVDAVGGGSVNLGLIHSAPIGEVCVNGQESIVFSGGVFGATITLDSSVPI